MVKTATTKTTKVVKASHGKRSAIADDTDNIEASDMDDEEFAECLTTMSTTPRSTIWSISAS